ncbi:TolC family protein [Pendulispora brunnea]|uniref:TolC family protein n=1 Tax=Pendulispora brunnea TaxID=2905690 RepID=A0ABZ2KCX1_9BACT
MKRLLGACAVMLALWPGVVSAEPEGTSRFNLAGYLQEVAKGNLELVAQRTNVTIAQAQLGIAKVFPNPQLTGGLLQYDISKKDNPTATTVQLAVPLELGGKRSSRISVAESGVSVAQADTEDFLRLLRAAAANAYIDSLHARLVLERKRRTLASLESLVAVNTQRLRVGDIGEALLVQSRVEAQQFRAQVISAEGDVRATDLALVGFMGNAAAPHMRHALDLGGDLRAAENANFDVEGLVRHAMAQRPDLRSAKRRVALARSVVDLTHANRVIDVTLGANWQHNFATSGTTNLPASDWLGGTLSVPLPFSRVYRGDLDAAYAAETQSNTIARAAEIHVEVEVRQAVARYQAASSRVKLYTQDVLSDADKVLEKTLYNYQRGGATLVEVLVAQRTVDDVYLSYYDALTDSAHTLVEVQQASAFWNFGL